MPDLQIVREFDSALGEWVTRAQVEATSGATTLAGVLASGNDANGIAITGLGAPTAGDDADTPDARNTAIAALSSVYQPLDADLSAIAGLASAANKMPYATDAQAWSLTDLTAFARTLLDDADAATAQTTLGIPGAVGGAVWTTVTKGSDESVASNTTPQDDDALFFTAVSGALYEIELYVIYASPAGGTTPCYVATYGEDTTGRGNGWSHGFNVAGTIAFAAAINFNQTLQDTRQTETTNRAYRLAGWHLGNGGTWRLKWAQAASSSNATVVRAGSVLRYRRIV